MLLQLARVEPRLAVHVLAVRRRVAKIAPQITVRHSFRLLILLLVLSDAGSHGLVP